MAETLAKKSLRALAVAIEEYPRSVADLGVLFDLNPRFGEALKQKGLDLSKLKGLSGPREIWAAATTPQLLDWAYARRLPGFEGIRKNVAPYQVISDDDYEKLVHPREYAGRHYHELGEEGAARLHEEAEKRRELANGLATLDEDIWPYYALPSHNMTGLTWLARNFTIREDRPMGILLLAAEQGKVSAAKQIYEAYKDKVDWRQLAAHLDLFFGHPFFNGLLEDRAAFAYWFASVFDMASRVVNQGKYLFDKLLMLNNLAAVKWLVQKYNPPAKTAFGAEGPKWIGSQLWLLEHFGRAELAQFLSQQYHAQAVAMTPEELSKSYSRLALPPPPTKRWSEVPEGYWPK